MAGLGQVLAFLNEIEKLKHNFVNEDKCQFSLFKVPLTATLAPGGFPS